MSAPHAGGYAYVRASARGVLVGLLLSVVLVAPFAISASDPTASQPTNPPASQPVETPEPAVAATAAPSPSSQSTEMTEPTDASATSPTPGPTDGPTPLPTPTPTAAASVTYIVTFATTDAFIGRAALFAATGAIETEAIAPLRMAAVDVPLAGASAAAATLRVGAGVAAVERGRERTIEATPNDALFADQWALSRIGWTDVYGSAAPSGSAIVAILDTGIDGSHPDLAGSLVPGAAFVGDAAPDTDPNGHGTYMAGIVAAHVDNATGIAGVAFAGVRLMPVTVLGVDGTGADGDIIAGLVWAVDHGADVVLMSFSSPSYSPALQAALDYAWSHDVVLVAATGNDGVSTVTYPAGDRGVIGVSNTDQNDELNHSSNYGDATFLGAPGTSIVTTAPGGHYQSVDGTSAAAAMVAGAAGLLRAVDPTASNGQVAYRLAATAVDVAAIDQVGNGRLDLAGALASRATDSVQPAGAGVLGEGGPIVPPVYEADVCAWTGAASTAWEDAANWSGCLGVIPTTLDDVTIGVTANGPLISSASGTVGVKKITIAVGATVTQTGGTLQVASDWRNSGTFNGTSGTVQFVGNAGAGADFSTSNQFYDVVVDAGIEPSFDSTAGSVINVSHDFTNNSTTMGAGSAATFVFNGTGAQSIYSAKTGTAATFGNLTVSKASGTLTLTSNANVTALVSITAGTVDLGTFTMNRATNGAGLSMSAGTLLRIGGSTGPTGFTTSTLNATSTVEYYGGAQSVTALNYGNLTLNNGNTKTAAAAITVNGVFLIDSTTTFAASTFTHNVNGALTVNGTFSPDTGTANFAGGSAQAISGSTTPITFNSLTVNKTGTLTTSNNLSVAGNLTVTAGTLDLGAYTANRTAAGGTLSVAAGATLRIGGTNGFPSNYTTNTLNVTSTVEFNGTVQTVAAQTYGHLTLSGGSTKTPASGLTVNGDFTIGGNTTFAAGSLTHNFAGNFTNNGTFGGSTSTAVFSDAPGGIIGGSSQTAFGAISITTGVMTLNTSATATALTFQNNNVANSLTHASGIDLTVNGNVTIIQPPGTDAVHAWNVNAGTATVTGSVTFSVSANDTGRIAKVAITTGTVTVQGDVIMTNAVQAASSVIDMSGGAGTLNLGGALTVNTLGTLTPGTSSTVVYNGTGAQTVTLASAITYSTLKIDKSGGTATLGAAATTSNVTNITIQQGTLDAGGFNIALAGAWTNNGGTFSGGVTTVTFSGTATVTGTAATAFPNVSIAVGATVAMNNSNSAETLTYVAGNTATSLTHANGTTFTVSGAVTLNQPTGSVTSTWNINAATVTTNGLITFAGTNTTAARLSKITITSGTLNANAGITFVGSVAASKVVDMSGGAGTLNLKGALTVPAVSSTLTAGTAGSTFVYADTAAQTINFFSAGAYHNLSVSNSHASGATQSAAISAANVTGNVRVLTGGELDNGGFAIVGNVSKTFEVQDGALFRLGGTSAWPTGFGTFTLGSTSNSSTVEYYGGAQNVVATATIGANFDNLTLSGSTVTKTLLGNITADALLNVGSTVTLSLADKNATVGSLTGAGTVQFGNGAVANTFTVGSDSSSTTFSGVFNSTNDATDVFVKNGSGTLTVSNTHTFTGTYKASAGTLLLTGTLAATSATTLDGGVLAGTGTTGIVSGSANGGSLGPGNPASSTGTISTRNFAFAAQSTYSVQLNGTTAGTNYDQTSVTGTVNLASATLSLSLGYSPSVGDALTIIANDSTDAVIGTFTGQAEGSTVTVSGVSFTVSYVGGTGNDVTLTVGSITNTWTGAVGNNWSTAGNWQDNRVPAAGHVLIFPSGATSFTPNNDLAAATSFAAITISGSGYTIGGNSITLGANNLTASYASGTSTINLAIVLSADRSFTVSNASATLVLGGVVSGAFTLTKAGSGVLAVTTANTYSATTISAGRLTIGIGSMTGTLGSGSVSNSGVLAFNRSNAMTVNNTISGSGSVTQSGSGTTTLGGSNSYSGATTISAGTLSISADNNLGTAPGSATPGQLTFSGGTLATTATFTLNANRGLAFSSTGTIDVAAATVLTYNGIAAGLGGLTKTSTGTLTLGGANTFSGATTISAGTLSIAADTNLGTAPGSPTAGQLAFNGGTLATTASFTLSANRGMAYTSTATIDVAASTTLTYNGIAAGAGGLTKSNTGSLVIGGTNTFSGSTMISAGTLSISADANLGTAPGSPTAGKVVFNGGTLATTASFTLNANRGMSFSSTATVDVAGSTTLIYNGIAAGASGLVKTGSGQVTLGGVNTFSGASTINAGTVSIAADSGLGTAPGSPTAGQITFGGGTLGTTASFTLNANRGIAFSSGATIDVASSTTLTYNGIAAGANGLTKTSVGTLVLGGNNTYSGTTTISAGTLVVNGSQGGSAVSVNGGTLGGSGTVGTVTSTASGGSVAPGNAGPAILNGGNLNLSAAGTRSVVVELNGTTAGSGYDQLNITGTVNLTGATLSGTVGFTPVGGNAFTIITNDGADAVTGTFSGLAEGADVVLSGFTFGVSYVGGTGNDVVLTKRASLSGNVFEDLNYGGGAGRTKAASSGSGRDSARVELYTSAGVYSTFTTTDASGNYTFGAVAPGTYYIRVVNSSVTSSRSGYTSSALAVMTYRTDATSGSAASVTDYVGGTNPAVADPGDGSAGATFNTSTYVYTAVLSGTAQSVTKVVASTTDITGLDFGFNFDTIVNVNDSGQGSMRAFITNANLLANAGLAQSGRTAAIDNAVLMISNGTAAAGLRAANSYFSGGIATISPTSALPTITDPVILDAQTQPGWTSTPIVQLSGTSAGAGAKGLYITAGSSTVRGWIINAFTGNSNSAAIWIATSGSNVIQGNYLGTNAAGSAPSANYQGVMVSNTASNTIGGTSATTRNVISGNTWRGIFLDGGASSNGVRGNYIGLDATGTTAVANNIGITIWSSPSNTIGGTGLGDGNVISGNTQIGIYVVFSASSSNTIQGNTIGRNAAGTASVPNGTQGVEICCSGDAGSNNTIGGTANGAANVISGNGGVGVRVSGGTGNAILTNSIYGNGGIGIDLGSGGVTANNGTKNGTLPNSEMDFPVFTSAVIDGTTLDVVGYVGSAPSQSLFASSRVEVFKSDIDGSGNGEGRTYLGYVTADASGNLSGTITGVSGIAVGDSITGTATDTSSSTSEFGANVVVAATAYVSASTWATSASASRYIAVAFPAYVPTGATVFGATFNHSYRSYQASGTTCYYIEVYEGASLIGTHGSAGSPISCQSGSAYVTDVISLSEVNTAARANTLSVRLIVWNSAGARSEHKLAEVSVDYQLN